MFCGLPLKCCFLLDFHTFLKSFEAPFCIIFPKKLFRKSLQKRRLPYLKFAHYQRVRRLPGTPPRVRITQTRNNSSSSNCCSNSCPWLWLRKIARKWLFELIAIATVSKKIENMERADLKSTFLMIWHALGKGPANSVHIK